MQRRWVACRSQPHQVVAYDPLLAAIVGTMGESRQALRHTRGEHAVRQASAIDTRRRWFKIARFLSPYVSRPPGPCQLDILPPEASGGQHPTGGPVAASGNAQTDRVWKLAIHVPDSEQTTVNEAIRKADVLLEAMEWIRHFRGRFVVIKLGGSALDDPQAVQRCLTDVMFMESVGMKPILVHGGGKAISGAMAQSGIEPRFVRGRRVTDKPTMDIVSRVLGGEVCHALVQQIRAQGGQAEPLNTAERQCLSAERLTLAADTEADLGFVGQVVDVNRELLVEITDAATIPVIPSIGTEVGGQLLNINADTAAAAVARFMGAEKLMFLSDVPGIFANRQDCNSLISHLDSARCRELIADGTIDEGMLPKVDAALEALDFGVKKVHIVDASIPHSMLLEIYSNTGIGTEIVG